MRAMMIVALLVAGLMGGAFVVSPAHAKCVKSCKQGFISEFHLCKKACKGLTGAEKKQCKKDCVTTKQGEFAACKAATTPGACSPSGAFID